MIVKDDMRFELKNPNRVRFALGHIDDLNRIEALGGVEVKTFLMPNGMMVVIPIDEFNKRVVLDSNIILDNIQPVKYEYIDDTPLEGRPVKDYYFYENICDTSSKINQIEEMFKESITDAFH